MKYIVLLISVFSLLSACTSDAPSTDSGSSFSPSGAASALTQAEFSALSPLQQYEVANKLLSTMQRGISFDDFFDLSQGTDNLVVANTNFINDLQSQLRQPLSTSTISNIENELVGPLNENGRNTGKYSFFREQDTSTLKTLAYIREYPISRDMFSHWAAHFLANTIMFSPALEMDSTDFNDITFVLGSLQQKILTGTSVRAIVGSHLGTQSRWRVSRSAENHALEALELYLGIFADTPEAQLDIEKGGQACQNLYLTNANNGYRLAETGSDNDEQLTILENYIVIDCNDFYAAIAQHPALISRVTSVIVNYIMNGRPGTVRTAVIDSIVNSGATTFEDIFKGVIFSKEYLLNTERPISYEDNMLAMMHRLKARPVSGQISRSFFDNFAGKGFLTDRSINIGKTAWSSSEYKIGRPQNVPMDGLSFAGSAYMGGFRRENGVEVNHVGLALEAYDSSDEDTLLNNTRVRPLVSDLAIDDYLDYLFISALARKATPVEKSSLIAFFEAPEAPDSDFSWLREDNGLLKPRDTFRYRLVTEATFDYISRLDDFYFIKVVQ